MTPTQLAAWSAAIVFALICAVVIGAIIYGITQAVRNARHERKSFNQQDTNRIYTSTQEDQ